LLIAPRAVSGAALRRDQGRDGPERGEHERNETEKNPLHEAADMLFIVVEHEGILVP